MLDSSNGRDDIHCTMVLEVRFKDRGDTSVKAHLRLGIRLAGVQDEDCIVTIGITSRSPLARSNDRTVQHPTLQIVSLLSSWPTQNNRS